MKNRINQTIYRLWAPLYDFVFGPLFARERQKAIGFLDLEPNHTLLIPGLGTGLDLPFLPPDIQIIGGDYSNSMLNKAQDKTDSMQINLHRMDAQHLALADSCVDAVLLNLILSVVPDGKQAFKEARRVLKPGGKMVIFDKFLPDTTSLTIGRRILGAVIQKLGTDPNRRLSDIVGDLDNLVIRENKASLLNGQYRIVLIEKPS